MAYPFLIMYADKDSTYEYLVRANDMRKARERALRQHQEACEGPVAPDLEPSRCMELTPKQIDGKFWPRIDLRRVTEEPCDTRAEAEQAALDFLAARRSDAARRKIA